MSGGTRIIPIDGADTDAAYADSDAVPDSAMAAQAPDSSPEDEAFLTLPDRSWIAPALAAAVVAAWTALFGIAVVVPGGGFSGAASAGEWTGWIGQWSGPVLVVMVLLLIVMRTSRREAARFGDVSRGLALETARLDQRLSSLNTELSLAREFIAAQARDLESLGRIAVDRLSGSARQLEDLVSQNGTRVDQIAQVSASALDNMEKLRSQLPVIANAAKDVTNNIGNAGRTAHLQLEEMVSGFQRLNDFGLASERQVGTVRERIDAAIASFSQAAQDLAGLAEGRFEALRDSSVQQTQAIAAAEADAIAAWQQRAQTHTATLSEAMARFGSEHEALLGDATDRLARFEESARALGEQLAKEATRFDESLAQRRASAETASQQHCAAVLAQLRGLDDAIAERRAAMDQAATDAAEALAAKLAQLDAAVSSQREAHLTETESLAARCEDIGQRISAFSDVLRGCGDQGAQTATQVDEAMERLNTRLAEMRHALAGTDLQIGDLTDSSVRLLELIQAGADHTRTQIPEALRSTEAGLRGLEDRVFTLRDTLRETGDGGRSLSDAVALARSEITATLDTLNKAQQALDDQTGQRERQVAALRLLLAETRKDGEAVSLEIEKRLSGAIEKLVQAAGKAGQNLRETTAGEIEAIASNLGEESAAAIARVLRGRAAELVGRLEEAIDAAAAASRETAILMRDQLTKVDELAGNLEARVARAREQAEEQVDNDFARRAALITESLNSSAIDITKALSTDVSETAWASYLRGDRGIFTRRAVSLLENAEAKAVQAHYETQSEFREHVNRYIHDFESMLRQLLSTRDGNALGVTLLSSDMGKLYVALAQGIDRLRA